MRPLIELSRLRDPYRAQHYRVRAARGKASEYPCAEPDCLQQACDWALKPLDDCHGPLAVVCHQRRPAWLSEDTSDYVPLCRAHHRARDAAARRAWKAMGS